MRNHDFHVAPPKRIRHLRLTMTLVALALLAIAPLAASDDLDFNRDIKPILSENCFFCHGQDDNHRMGDLRLDRRDDAIEKGAIVPGDAAASALVTRILADDADALMPPPASHRELTESQKELLIRWINAGAAYEPHWAFIAPTKPNEPAVNPQEPVWVQNPIDSFVLEKLNSIDLSPAPPAARATLIRRLYADLIGLPPSPDQVAQFVHDADPQAYEKLVDRLLASPHYGERMAISWLDAARYADSNGFQQDGDTWQWMWRDWVVKALNEDLPFDQFSIWQLAGDLLDNPTLEQQIASAFNRNHLLNGEGGGIAEEQRFVILFDRIDTTSTNWLGMTVACAQCHSHKYDPISQQEYYQLLDLFNRVPEVGRPEEIAPIRFRLDTPYIELPTEEQKQRLADLQQQLEQANSMQATHWEIAFTAWKLGVMTNDPNHPETFSAELKAVLSKPDANRSESETEQLQTGLRKHFDERVRPTIADAHPILKRVESLQKQIRDFQKAEFPRVMVMSDAQPRTTHILNRGQYLEPLEPVTFDTPEFLPPLPADFPRNRLGFARWLFLPENPLVARVQVNRIWQHFFGSGLVKTSEDFGIQSEYPLHRDLLDWLAAEFRENGWSVKKLQRLILTSATYQRSSRVSERHRQLDAENRYYARASRFRLPAMVLRDWALAASGLLAPQLGGAPVYPYQPAAVWESLAITKERDFTYPQSTGAELYRRSLYTFWRRTISPANMFDSSNRQACRVRATLSNTPLHALTTLNDPTWVEASRVLAENCLRNHHQLTDQMTAAFVTVLCRHPTAAELAKLTSLWQRQLEFYQADSALAETLRQVGTAPTDSKLDPVALAAMTNVCLALFNLDEALTRE